jgi:pyruvate/2-oxoglutarate dehydrogenase complex dihydrolipoamide acyltransferase (E2) component
MPSEITMPQLSDTMTEGTLVKWKKKEGEKVASGEEIAEVETDKATMPMEAFDAGTLAVQAIPEGGKVAVGGLVGVIALAGEKVEEIKKKYAAGGGAAVVKPAPTAPVKSSAPNEPNRREQTFATASRGEMHETDADLHNASRGNQEEMAAATAVVDAPVSRHEDNDGGRISRLT